MLLIQTRSEQRDKAGAEFEVGGTLSVQVRPTFLVSADGPANYAWESMGRFVGLPRTYQGRFIGVDRNRAGPNTFCLMFRFLQVSRLCTRLSLER